MPLDIFSNPPSGNLPFLSQTKIVINMIFVYWTSFISLNLISLNYIGLSDIGHDDISHDDISLDYISLDFIGRLSIGHFLF